MMMNHLILEEEVNRIPYGGCHGPAPKYKKYGTYHSSEGSSCYIAQVENNAPAMSEELWKIREQLSIAEKRLFDSIIEMEDEDFPEYTPPMREHGITDKGLMSVLCERMGQDTPSGMQSWTSVLRGKIDKDKLVQKSS
jgi:hypothetical protein